MHTLQHGATEVKRMSQNQDLVHKVLQMTEELKHTYTGGSKDSKIDSGTVSNILHPSGRVPGSRKSLLTFYLSKEGSSKQVDESYDTNNMLSFNGNFPQIIQGENSELSKDTFYGFDQFLKDSESLKPESTNEPVRKRNKSMSIKLAQAATPTVREQAVTMRKVLDSPESFLLPLPTINIS